MSFFGGLIAFAFGAILRFLFGAVAMAYDVIIVLANVDLFGFNQMDQAGSLWHSINERIYILLGIFMLFRVGFSMLQYIINPDKMTDKQAGIGNIIKRTIIALLILVLFQPAFALLMSFQNKIISSNVLGTVILGVQGDPTNKEKDMGNVLPSTIIQAMTSVSKDWSDANNAGCNDLGSWAAIIADNGECKKKLEEGMDDKYKLEEMVIPANWQRWFDAEITTKGTGLALESAAYQSNFLLLAIVALIVLWCLFSLGLQLGVRIIKLGFLAMIAPIPIISYIEPSQGKNGMLGKWAKELLKTYLSLFIRLAALYFAILIVILVEDAGATDPFKAVLNFEGEPVSDNILVIGQVKVIVLIAAFLFADQVPKMIENIFGLKMEGGMFKSPFKQMRESKSLMGAVGGAVGAGLGAARALPQLKKLKTQASRVGHGLNNKYDSGISKDKLKAGMKAYGNLAHKAGANVANIGRSTKRMAKDLQENKQGFVEGMIDSQTKAAEEGYNKASRVGTSMADKILGKQFPLKEKKEVEAVKAKSANGIVSEADSDTEKKNNNFKNHKLAYEGKKAEYEAARETGKDSEVIKAEEAVTAAKAQEVAMKEHIQQQTALRAQKIQDQNSLTSRYQLNESRIQRLDVELETARRQGLPQATIDTLSREKTNLTLENQQLTQNIDGITAEIGQIDNQISLEQANIAAAQQSVSVAEANLKTANDGFKQRMEVKMAEINDLDKQMDDAKKFYASEKIRDRMAVYDILKERYETGLKNGTISRDKTFAEYFEQPEIKEEFKDTAVEIDNDFRKFAEQLTTLEKQLGSEGVEKMREKIKTAKKRKIVETTHDAEGNEIKVTKEVEDYRGVLKDLADEASIAEQRLGREIEEIEKGTRGMGVVNEVVNMGDFGDGSGE